MALIKYKPRTPGTRAVVKIDRSHLHKGGPHLPLTAAQSKTGARNHFGRITTRHHGGGSRQKYRVIDLDRKSTRLNSSHSQISYAVFCLKKKKRRASTRSERSST